MDKSIKIFGMSLAVEHHKTLHPLNIGMLGAKAIVLVTDAT